MKKSMLGQVTQKFMPKQITQKLVWGHVTQKFLILLIVSFVFFACKMEAAAPAATTDEEKTTATITFKLDSGDKVYTVNKGDTFAFPSEILRFDYRRLTTTSPAEKQVWRDQDSKEFDATQKISKDLTYTAVWRATSIKEVVDDLVGKWVREDKRGVNFIERVSPDSDRYNLYGCFNNVDFTDSEIAAMTKTSQNCSIWRNNVQIFDSSSSFTYDSNFLYSTNPERIFLLNAKTMKITETGSVLSYRY